MATPIPTSSDQKRALVRQMREAAPELMAEIEAIRKEFPSAKITYFHAGSIEVGEPALSVAEEVIWPIPDGLGSGAVNPLADAEKAERKRQEALARQRVKQRRSK